MTFIDPATGWFEITEVPLDDQSSARISKLFYEVWLSRYSRPKKVLYDNGSEFKKDFQPILKDFAIQAACTSIKNPQSNAILERIHQVVGSMLKTQDLKEKIFDSWKSWSKILASVAYAIMCSYQSTLQATPCQLVFGRDMLLNIGFEPNYEQVWARKQRRINYDNVCENAKLGDYAYVLRDGIYRKLDGDKLGPYHVNTIRIQKGILNERTSICCLTPHFGQPQTEHLTKVSFFVFFVFTFLFLFLIFLEIVSTIDWCDLGGECQHDVAYINVCYFLMAFLLGYPYPNNRRSTN